MVYQFLLSDYSIISIVEICRERERKIFIYFLCFSTNVDYCRNIKLECGKHLWLAFAD